MKNITINDKSLANAVRKGDISLKFIDRKRREKIKYILKNYSIDELNKASKNKYKFSKRKIKNIKNKKNESMENKEKKDFKKIITNLEDWEDEVQGGLAKNKKPSDYDIEDLAKGAEIQTEHTDDPRKAIDIAMDHLEEFDDYYDDEKGLPAMERGLEDEDYDSNDDDDDDDDGDMKKEGFIKKFDSFLKMNENKQPKEPKMYPRENKFKRVIESSDNIEESLIEHGFSKINDEESGDFIIYNIMEKTYEFIDDEPDDIRPVTESEFDHIMNNL